MISRLLSYLARRSMRVFREPKARPLVAQGIALHAAGDAAGARGALEQALAIDPDNAGAHHWLGVVLAGEGAAQAGAEHLERAILLDPKLFEAYNDLGYLYFLQGNHPRAITLYRRALAIAPEPAQARHILGLLLKDTGDRDEGLVHLREANRLAPDDGALLRSLVVTLVEVGLFDEAVAVAGRAVARNAGSAEAQRCLGYVFQNLHEPANALKCYEEAMRLGSDDADFHNDRAVVMQDLGRLPEAFECYERALARRPDFPQSVFHRGLARLLTGDYVRGWADYEARHAVPGLLPVRPASFPRWDGAPLAGRTLLVYGEQGLGDEIMFASCLPQAMAAGGPCIIECAPKLRGLLARSFPEATVYPAVPDRRMPPVIAARPIDFEIAMGSLPRLFRRSLGEFPRHEGYLSADPARVARWRERLARLGDGLKIGISWRGGVHKTRRPLRSLTLGHWLPILRVPGARFVSLQYTAGAEAEAAQVAKEHGVLVTHWPDAIADYEDTAALVAALDLVVSVCTAVIHLGGALGRPVWVMAPYSAEWRYGASGDAMPWYPSVRLFRQPAFGQWEPVISSVAGELERRAVASGG